MDTQTLRPLGMMSVPTGDGGFGLTRPREEPEGPRLYLGAALHAVRLPRCCCSLVRVDTVSSRGLVCPGLPGPFEAPSL